MFYAQCFLLIKNSILKRSGIKYFCYLLFILTNISCSDKEIGIDQVEISFEKNKMIFIKNDKPFNGIIIERYDDDKIKLKMEIKNGFKNGEIIQYFENGYIQTKSYFQKGEIDGVFKSFYPNGSLQLITYYQNDKKSGSFEEFFINGALKSCSNYFLGVKIGKSYAFFESGGVAIYDN